MSNYKDNYNLNNSLENSGKSTNLTLQCHLISMIQRTMMKNESETKEDPRMIMMGAIIDVLHVQSATCLTLPCTLTLNRSITLMEFQAEEGADLRKTQGK